LTESVSNDDDTTDTATTVTNTTTTTTTDTIVDTETSLQTIATVKSLDSGAEVVTQGVVTALPGVYSSSYFYMQDDTGGIQVYSSDQAFPQLAVGDLIVVTGSRGTSNGEAKINISAAEDITVTTQNQSITPASDLTDTALNAGRIVTAAGVVSQRSGSTVTLDTGTIVYIKRGTGISTSSFIEGETVTVTGVLVVTDDDTQVWPRSTNDVVFGSVMAASSIATTETASGSGDVSVVDATISTTALDSTIESAVTQAAPYWPWLALGLGLVSLGLLHYLWQNTRLRDWVRARGRALASRLGCSVASEKNTTDSNDQNQYRESHLWGKTNV
jgi:DNA/RNA endonuclease YhcR with UshA esterase domain